MPDTSPSRTFVQLQGPRAPTKRVRPRVSLVYVGTQGQNVWAERLGRTPSLPTTNPLIVIGDSIKRKPSLDNLFLSIRKANASLPEEQQIKYVVCEHTYDVALSLREYKKNVRLVLLGNDVGGQPAAIARLLSKAAKMNLHRRSRWYQEAP